MNVDTLLKKGVSTVLPTKEGLEKLLSTDKKLNVYLGIDPTATRIHLGHAVALRKLQGFVELGHNVVFLIGDFTALIGDTSDKDTERPILSSEEIKANFETYKEQASKILDFSKVKVVHNSEWLSKLSFTDIVKLCQNFSVGDFVGRELIKKRLTDGKKVGLHETLYPVMQGYDSYHLDTDIQIGGSDQTFNMLAGRTLQKNLRDKESFVLCVDYLPGTDGRKMSKSWGNAIWLTDTPNDMYGKVMSLKDELIETYFSLATASSPKVDMNNPMEAKKILAFQIVTELHNEKAAEDAQTYFEQTFQKAKPEFKEILTAVGNNTLAEVLLETVGSNSELKRLIHAGAIEVNGKQVANSKMLLKHGDQIKVGKRGFYTFI